MAGFEFRSIVFELLAGPAKRYKDPGSGYHAKRMDTGRRAAQLAGEPRALGRSVTLAPFAAWHHHRLRFAAAPWLGSFSG